MIGLYLSRRCNALQSFSQELRLKLHVHDFFFFFPFFDFHYTI